MIDGWWSLLWKRDLRWAKWWKKMEMLKSWRRRKRSLMKADDVRLMRLYEGQEPRRGEEDQSPRVASDRILPSGFLGLTKWRPTVWVLYGQQPEKKGKEQEKSWTYTNIRPDFSFQLCHHPLLKLENVMGRPHLQRCLRARKHEEEKVWQKRGNAEASHDHGRPHHRMLPSMFR